MPHLIPHPHSPGAATGLTVEANLLQRSGSTVTVDYRVTGSLNSIVIPPPVAADFADGLWEHTCFELFVAITGEDTYHEFNFSPSGQWALFGFSEYRKAAAICASSNYSPRPQLDWQTKDEQLRLTASLDLAGLPAPHESAQLDIGLSAVIEGADGAFSYWALHHAAGPPDFHQRAAFDLRVEADAPA
jgi:hypothetical protein